MLNKWKKNDKKGFTLVELIVVLVILAILAALLVPALTGYIDKAKRKSIVAETRQVVMAAQTLVDEAYGKKTAGTAVEIGDRKDVTYVQIKELAEVNGTITSVELNQVNATGSTTLGTVDDTHPAGTVVAKVVYENSGKACTYYALIDDFGTTEPTDGNYNVVSK